MKAWLQFIGAILPAIVDFIKWLASLSSDEFEEISKAWPAPTKTEMAWIRAEAKARLHFFPKDHDGE